MPNWKWTLLYGEQSARSGGSQECSKRLDRRMSCSPLELLYFTCLILFVACRIMFTRKLKVELRVTKSPKISWQIRSTPRPHMPLLESLLDT